MQVAEFGYIQASSKAVPNSEAKLQTYADHAEPNAMSEKDNWMRFGMIYLPVLASSELKSADKVVYAAISMHCGGLARRSKVSQAKLAHETNLGPRTVQRAVKNLKQLGLLEAHGNGKSNTYRLLTPDRPVVGTDDILDVRPTTSVTDDSRHSCRMVQERRMVNNKSKRIDGLEVYRTKREKKWIR